MKNKDKIIYSVAIKISVILFIVFFIGLQSKSIAQPIAPTNVIATPNSITCGSATSLNATTSGSNVIIRWWDASTGGNLIGSSASGVNFSFIPSVSMSCYAEAYDINTFLVSTSRTIVGLTISSGSISPPTSISAYPSSVTCGNTTNLSATLNSGTIYWWDAPYGGNLIGTSQSSTFLNIIPPASTNYYAQSITNNSLIFNYTGAMQTWTIPAGVTSVNVDAIGASGGNASNINYGTGGLGGRVQATLSVTPGSTIFVNVGGQGGIPSVYSAGWNGGGIGSNYTNGLYGGGGGGATDIRIGGSTLASRVIVAGGGGGANGNTFATHNNGGAGGDLTGGYGVFGGTNFSTTYCGSGGSQSAGGASGTGAPPSSPSGLGVGAGCRVSDYGAGGGGGFYGGGAGIGYGGGGGGSNYVTTSGTTNIIRTTNYWTGNGQLTLTWGFNGCSSTRVSVSVTISGGPTLSSISANPSSINCGGNSNLIATSSGNVIRWWSGATGGTLLGTSGNSASFNVSPSSNTIYFAEAYTSPCASTRIGDTVIVNSSLAPTLVTATPSTVSCGSITNLYGTTTSGIIRWWDSPSGGNFLGTSQISTLLSLSPSVSTTYYAETYNYISGSQTFNYTGSSQAFTVPLGITSLNVDVKGAQGGNATNTTYGTGGLGGRMQGTISVMSGQTLYIYVGGSGGTVGGGSWAYSGGWNGGGTGSMYNNSSYGGGGGGGSDIRTTVSLNDRIIVAGGGGGANGFTAYTNNNGGAGGDLTGGNGIYGSTNFSASYCGSGGTQTAGGASATYYTPPVVSGLGVGATSYTGWYGAGGGGGYYGGGAGCFYGGGGGGSNYVATTGISNIIRSQGYQSGNGQITVSWAVTHCISSTRTSVIVTVNPIASPVLLSNPSVICAGSSSSLIGISAGNNIVWWDAVTGGNLLANTSSGGTYSVTPSVTAVYYAEAVQTNPSCTSLRNSITVTVFSLPIIPSPITANPSTIYCGDSTILNAVNSGGIIRWWNALTGGIMLGTSSSGTNLTISLSTTTTCYAESYNNGCSSSTRNGITVTVNPLPVPSSLTASPSNICNGTSSSLSAITLEGFIRWWTALSGGTLVGSTISGAFISVSPTITTAYYAETFSACTSPLRASVTVTVFATPFPPTLVRTDTTNICSNYSNNVTLSASGGTGTSFGWYTSGCGIISLGTGNPLSIAPPIITTTYWANSLFTGCANSSCQSVTVSVIPSPVAPTSVKVDTNNYCPGYVGNINLSASGGSGTVLIWYTTSCGGNQIGTGIGLTLPAPTSSISYFACWQTSGCSNSMCTTLYINIIMLPLPPSIAISDRNNFCSNAGGNISLSASGGFGTSLVWYRVSCGGTLVGSGNPKVLAAPVSSITYWARWENICGNSTCVSRYITVLSLAVAPVSVAVDRNNLCSNDGGNINLSESGGSGVSINWYTVSCGGTSIGTGKILTTLAPTITSTYWVRWTNTCGSTTCKSIIVTINTLPSQPLSAATDRNYFCPGAGGNISLSTSGGSGIITGWYIVSCSYAAIGTGNPLVIAAPSSITTYWANKQITGCSNSSCVSITITVMSSTIAPDSAFIDRNNICANDGSTINLNISGGWGTTVGWYTVNCGGTFVGTGNPINLTSPIVTTTYWANWQSIGCTNSICISITETVNPAPMTPLSLSSNNNNYCPGTVSNITLSTSGGSGTVTQWSSSSCGGTVIGTGNQIVISAPTSLTSYYNWWQLTGCNNSACLSITISLNSITTIPSTVAGVPLNVCPGTASVLTETGGVLGTGANWYWYAVSCGGALVGTSNTTTQYPTTSATYWVRGEGTCNTTSCLSRRITVTTAVSSVTLTGAASVCSGYTQQYNATYYSAYTYTWSAPSGWTGTSTSCSVTFITGSLSGLISVIPSSTCGTGTASSKYVTINDSSVTPTSITASPNGICIGGSGSTLTVNGGSLGTGGIWKWYSGSCGITISGTGLLLTINPTVNMSYWVRAEGTCNTTRCLSVVISINNASTASATATASPSIICYGSPTTLGITGGSLGTGANWNWYTGSCGGTYVISGATPVLSPTVTTTYYLLAAGICNTTSCANVTVNVNTLSNSATIASATSPICYSSPTTLGVTGGSLGTSANWNWYTGSCGGTYVISGATPVLSPTVTTTYYVLAAGICNTTSCANVTVNVNTLSNSVTTAIATSPICYGSPTTLGITGGSLGTSANWNWYTGSCGGTYVISGATPVLSPTVTTTYYVLAAGICNTTTCTNVIVNVNIPSTSPAGANASPSTICVGLPSSLGITGGSLGTGANWNWYTGSCSGTFIFSGSTPPAINPTVTTTYFASASGYCNTTSCVSTTVIVNTLSSSATGVSSATPICIGSTSVLYVNGGILGTGANWNWYGGSCNGTYVVSGATVVVTPTIATTYYVSAAGICNTTTCASTSVSFFISSVAATSATANPSMVCEGSPTTLSTNGGTLGISASWKWYASSCGGTFIATGNPVIVNPSATTTYYVRAEGFCGSTSCVTVTVTFNLLSVSATSASANPSTVCLNTSSTLSFIGGSLGTSASWFWYSSCGGTLLGNGTSIVVTPTATSTYYILASGFCNTTTCASVTVTVNYLSTSSTTVTASPSTICAGSLTTLGITGGSLGTSANWNWYTGSCGGTYVISGATPVLSPTVTTTYYVLAAGICDTTSCVNVTVDVNTLSNSATTAIATSPICYGSPTTLGIIGGSLGTSANWNWYTGSCGGTYVISGATPVLSPTVTTTYYVLAAGICNTTSCINVTVDVNTLSNSASTAIATSPICYGSPTTLGIIGGSLGTSANWNWYTGSCGGTYVISGATPVLSPTVTTTYYVLAAGICNTTSCVNVTVDVNTLSNSASTAIATSPICYGSSTTLGITGGSLGTGANWNWYTGSCGGTYVISGATPVLSPTVTTTYYVLAAGVCNTTSCVNITVDVNTLSNSATTTIATSPICYGSPTTLGIIGGSLGTSANWNWYTGSCGGTYVISGATPVLSPTVTTTYYVLAAGICNTTSCINVTVDVNTLSNSASTAIATSPICYGSPTTLGIIGGSLGTSANWNWYTGSCGGTYVISGATPVLSPTVTTTYYVLAAGICNTTSCVNVTVDVNTLSNSASTAIATSPICYGSPTTLGIIGGSLGTSANWNWYTGSCGGTYVISGATPVLSPTVTTTYYVLAAGVCNTTSCVNITVDVNTLSNSATTTIATSPICYGSPTTLGIIGGSLGTSANWNWYTGSCGGTYVISGATPVLSPTVTTTYYVLAAGICNTTSCVNITVDVNTLSNSATTTIATSPICYGSPTTLGIIGGSLGTSANWNWYTGSCGGTYVISGATPVLSPTVTTTYYVLAAGVCNTTSCVNITVDVNTLSNSATTTIATSPICYGSPTTLGIIGGSLGTSANWNWYTGSCGGTYVISGATPVLSPTVTTTYYVLAAGVCNTTSCTNVTVYVNTLSNSATTTIATSPICYGSPTTLGITGGSLGTSANWNWYTGSCGGTYVISEATPVLSPTVTTTYYVLAAGICNTTSCVNVTVDVNTLSNSASTAIATSPICYGSSTTLGITGGSLGTSANWNWYTGSCGGTYVISGATPVLSLTVTTIYYVQAAGICDTTSCTNVTVDVNTLSNSANTAIATSPICYGSSTTLGITGGSLGTSANWNWYTGSCGGTYVISGATPVLSPTVTTTYYVQAAGICDTTSCVNISIIVNDSSTAASSITTTLSNICSGGITTLGLTGGILGTSADWYWYSGSCGGTAEGNGLTIFVSPTITTDYYLRAEGVCNTTSCVNISTIVNDSSTAASLVTATLSNICSGGTTTLGLTGGILGTSADWYWYSGSCGGTAEGNGLTIFVSPTITTDYYLRAEGVCNTTSCVNISIIVNDSSTSASSVTTTLSNICSGGTTTLGLTGGILETSADWFWYSGSCGGISEGNGLTIFVSPTITTDYYLRAEGVCNTTSCVNISIIVNDSSTSASSVTTTLSNICSGGTTTLGLTGGILGTSADWFWYSGSCGGISEGNGLTIFVSPTITTDYYLRAEGVCNTTSCVNISIIVNDSSTAASSVTATLSNICSGGTATLGLTGGILGTSANWYWYSGSCTGIPVGNRDTLIVTPSVTTDYYLRAEGVCNTTSCVNISIIVNDSSTAASSVTATLSSICSGSTTTLGLTGGILGTSADWYWYSSSCGGTAEGNGLTIFVSPTITTDYYIRAEGICNTTNCINTIITVISIPLQPDTISGNINPTPGDTEVYSVAYIPGLTYIWTAPSGWTGTSNSNSIIFIVGSGEGSIFVISSNSCGLSPSRTMSVTTGYSISGYFTYDNNNNTPLDSVWVFLMQNGHITDSTQADINGYYIFNSIGNGTYYIFASTHKLWAGVNTTDAVKVKRHFAGSEYFTSSIRLHAADVNLSMNINTTDAVKITRRFVGSDTTFARGDWNFEKPYGGDTINVSSTLNDTIVVMGSNVVQDFKGTCVGDVNGSNLPGQGAKDLTKIKIDYSDFIKLNSNEYFEIPLKVSNDLKVGAISLILEYPKEFVSIYNVQFAMCNDKCSMNNDLWLLYECNNMIYNILPNELRIGWFEDVNALNLKPNDSIIIIRGKTTNNFKPGDIIKFKLKNDVLCELADENGEPIDNVILNTYSIVHKNTLNIETIDEYADNELAIYPNPANDKLNINYRIVKDEKVKIELFNLLGEKIEDILNLTSLKGTYTKEIDVSSLSPGIYMLKMKLDNNSLIIKRLVISR